jgi:hypothetical protein
VTACFPNSPAADLSAALIKPANSGIVVTSFRANYPMRIKCWDSC